MQASSIKIGNLRVRLVPDLSAAALRKHQSKLIAFWYILRTINLSGSGIISKAVVIDALVHSFGFAKRTAYAHLQQGNGVFWDVKSGRRADVVLPYGIARVAAILDVTDLMSRHFSEVPAMDFRTPRQRKAQLYASCLKPTLIGAGITGCRTDRVRLNRTVKKSNPISRLSLKSFTSLATSTQIRLERAAGVKREPHYAVWHDEDGTHPVRVTVEGKARLYEVDKQLPNSYQTKQRPGRRGMLKRICKKAA